MNLTYSFDKNRKVPDVVLQLPLAEVGKMVLSLANRELRNRKGLYQKKHILGTQKTRERKKELADLNIEIPEHFHRDLGIADVFSVDTKYLVVGVGDCTANLFRPSFDVSRETPLFFLEDEPILKKEYYAFTVLQKNEKPGLGIKKITFRDEIPMEKGQPIDNLKWLFCSTPLVYNGNIVPELEMVLNNYDLRHTFGKNAQEITNELYFCLREGYDKFVENLKSKKSKILAAGPEVEWYHAGIGVKENCVILIHNTGSLVDLALKDRKSVV